jgi:hypothetical protein
MAVNTMQDLLKIIDGFDSETLYRLAQYTILTSVLYKKKEIGNPKAVRGERERKLCKYKELATTQQKQESTPLRCTV